jgi:hypothetical protein
MPGDLSKHGAIHELTTYNSQLTTRRPPKLTTLAPFKLFVVDS